MSTDEVACVLVQADAAIYLHRAVVVWKLYVDPQFLIKCVVDEIAPFEYLACSHAVGAGMGEAFAHVLGQHHCMVDEVEVLGEEQ